MEIKLDKANGTDVHNHFHTTGLGRPYERCCESLWCLNGESSAYTSIDRNSGDGGGPGAFCSGRNLSGT